MKLLNTIAFAMISLVSMAQSSDRTSLGWYSATTYPELPIEVGAKNYTVLVNNSSPRQGSDFASFSFPSRAFRPVGATANADIVVSFDNIVIDEPIELIGDDPKTIVKTKDDGVKININKSGLSVRGGEKKEIIKTEGRYKAICNKTLGFDMTITIDGKIMHQETFSKTRVIESAWYTNPNQAEDSLKVKLPSFRFKGMVESANKVASQLVGDGWLVFGRMKFHCYAAKSTKKNAYDYSEINSAVDKMVKAFDFIDKNDWNVADFKETCEGVTEVWENELKNSDVTNKKARINDEVTCALNYNIGLYYMFTKEFETARKYFKNVFMIDPKFGHAKILMGEMPKCQKAKDRYEEMMKAKVVDANE